MIKALEKAPWWAQLAVWAGLPGALLTFIIWITFSGMSAAIAETSVVLKPHIAETRIFLSKLDDYMWIMCRASAKNERQVGKCDEIHDRLD